MAHKDNTHNPQLIRNWRDAKRRMLSLDEPRRDTVFLAVKNKRMSRGTVDWAIHRTASLIVKELEAFLAGSKHVCFPRITEEEFYKTVRWMEAAFEDNIQKQNGGGDGDQAI